MTRLRQRLTKLETHRQSSDEITFISTGVPAHDKVGILDVAITPQGWVTKAPNETDAQFRARVQRRQS